MFTLVLVLGLLTDNGGTVVYAREYIRFETLEECQGALYEALPMEDVIYAKCDKDLEKRP